jgi:hypothetical protein
LTSNTRSSNSGIVIVAVTPRVKKEIKIKHKKERTGKGNEQIRKTARQIAERTEITFPTSPPSIPDDDLKMMKI